MQSDLELLFKYLDAGNYDAFQRDLKKELVNKVWTDVLYNYSYVHYTFSAVKKKEIQNNLLIFRAMWRKAYGAFKLLLENGVDLLSQEVFETFDYVSGGINTKPIISKTDIAIICISNSEDDNFIQMTFDHICEKGLYENRIFIDFMIRHLIQVNRDKFNVKYLKIDVRSPLPFCFKTVTEYKDFLIEANIDLTGVFFVKEDYLNFILNPMSEFDKNFLNHALLVCDFTLDELKQIYESLGLEDLKLVVENFNPEVNTEFLFALDALCQAEEEKRSPQKRARSESPEIPLPAPSLPSPSEHSAPLPIPSKPAVDISAVHQQEFRHLTSRMAALEKQEKALREKQGAKKQRQKDKEALSLVLKSLKDIRERLYNNPCYKIDRADQNDDNIGENSPDI